MEALSIVLAGLYLFFSLLVLGVVYTLLRNRLPVQTVQPVLALSPEAKEAFDKYIREIQGLIEARDTQQPQSTDAYDKLIEVAGAELGKLREVLEKTTTPAPPSPEQAYTIGVDPAAEPYEMPHDVTPDTTQIHHALMIPQRDRLTITNDLDATFFQRWPLFAVEVLLDIRDLLRAKR